ncbi:MAG: PD40 domain-containing protein [Alphaproteobacteria bacterium]|nr:PD40 domain-containing protein [Alphaproteobacteria bacterium]
MFRIFLKNFILFFTLSIISYNISANGALSIDITQESFKPIKIALMPIENDNAEIDKDMKAIYKTVKSDLRQAGYFRLINQDAFIRGEKFGRLPLFEAWRQIDVDAIIQIRLDEDDKNVKKLTTYIWDVKTGQQIEAQAIKAKSILNRRFAHIIADIILTTLTDEDAFFDTKIAFITESDHKRPSKNLAIMDQDGQNFSQLTDVGKDDLVLSPAFSPNPSTIAFYGKFEDTEEVFIFDYNTGLYNSLYSFNGDMTLAPTFSKDGSKIAMSKQFENDFNLVEINLKNNRFKRLTHNKNLIDISPSYNHDGSKLVFSSDRNSQGQQLYVMDLTSKKVKRISFKGGNYSAPTWSPDGKTIAFVKAKKNVFYLGTIRPDGTKEKILTSGWFLDSPSWAPNSQRIVYFKTRYDKKGRFVSRLYKIHSSGQFERLVRTVDNASNPNWSGLLE